MKRRIACLVLFVAGVLAGRLFERGALPAWAGVSIDGDVNGDGALDLADPIHLLRFLFQGGEPPVSCAPGGGSPVTMVVLVRHAERITEGADPCLLPEGEERARRLAVIFRNADVQALISSQKCRTKKTLEPLSAAKNNLRIEELEGATNAETAALVGDRLQALSAGSVAVVAHHSFTLKPILEDLGIADTSAVDVNVYDNFLVILLAEGQPARMVPLTYY